MRLISMLRSGLRPYRRPATAILALQAVSMMGMLAMPTLNADIIDNGVVRGDTGRILRTGGLMGLLALVQLAGAAGALLLGARVAMAVGRDLRSAIFHRVQRFSAAEVGRFGTPSLINRITNDVQQVQMVALLGLTMLVSAPLMFVGGAVLAVRESPRLSVVLLVALPLLALIFAVILWRTHPHFMAMQDRLDRINKILREQITGVRVVRAFVKDAAERRRFQRTNAELTDRSIRVGKLVSLIFPLVLLLSNASSVAVLWFGGQLAEDGALQVGSLLAFLSYLLLVLMTVMMATFMFLMMPRAEICAARIQEVLDTEPTVLPPSAPVAGLPRRGEVALHGVAFGYPGAEQPVLHDIDLTVSPGETVALIGGTGSGKTTLLNLVPRLFDATAGRVLVGGADVRDLDPAVLSETVGYVPQRPYLFSGTVASNLRYGNPDATDAELWDALRVAQAAEFVERMPDGLDSPIAQGGSNVSGGQRQRLAIARALVRRPDICLFDDSFSALDYATGAALRAALETEIAGATLLIVAQQVAAIRHADRIVVLDQGRVVGAGTHEELLADANETYREIVLSQSTEAEAV